MSLSFLNKVDRNIAKALGITVSEARARGIIKPNTPKPKPKLQETSIEPLMTVREIRVKPLYSGYITGDVVSRVMQNIKRKEEEKKPYRYQDNFVTIMPDGKTMPTSLFRTMQNKKSLLPDYHEPSLYPQPLINNQINMEVFEKFKGGGFVDPILLK